MEGLSPRVRGNRDRVRLALAARRSIPACAGEPSRSRRGPPRCGVYPRVCGGTAYNTMEGERVEGLSPRVRGNRDRVRLALAARRSIPACAGEPSRSRRGPPRCGVYPRVCGGTAYNTMEGERVEGLSPRVRGNRDRVRLALAARRSIPACAGEPSRSRRGPPRCGVYPRVCGGTPNRPNSAPGAEGLSPRVRGNRLQHYGGRARGRSIPACAGEP